MGFEELPHKIAQKRLAWLGQFVRSNANHSMRRASEKEVRGRGNGIDQKAMTRLCQQRPVGLGCKTRDGS